jgi:hypothetical protein
VPREMHEWKLIDHLVGLLLTQMHKVECVCFDRLVVKVTERVDCLVELKLLHLSIFDCVFMCLEHLL